MVKKAAYKMIIIMCCSGLSLQAQITSGAIIMQNNANGQKDITDYTNHYQVAVAGVLGSHQYGNFSLRSDYFSSVSNGDFKHLFASDRPSSIGLYDLDLFLLNNSRMPLRFSLSERSLGKLDNENSATSFRFSGQIPANQFLPSIRVSVGNVRIIQKGVTTTERQNYSLGLGNTSRDSKSSYAINVNSNKIRSINRIDERLSVHFSNSLTPFDRLSTNSSLQFQNSSDILSYFLNSNTNYRISQKASFRSNITSTGQMSETALAESFTVKNDFYHRSGNNTTMRLFGNLNWVPGSKAVPNTGSIASTGLSLNKNFVIKNTRISTGIRHNESFRYSRGIDYSGMNTSLLLGFPLQISRKVSLRSSSNISHTHNAGGASLFRNQNNLSMNMQFNWGGLLGVVLSNSIAVNQKLSSIQNQLYNLQLKLNFSLLRLPVLIGSDLQHRLSDSKRYVSYNTFVKLPGLRLGRSGNLAVHYNNSSNSYQELVEKDPFENRPATIWDTRNRLILSGNYRLFAYQINGQLHYNLSKGQSVNRYNLSIRRTISFGG